MKLPKFKGKVFLAPMMDITDSAFRSICKEKGASLVYTELTSIHHVLAKGKKAFNIQEKERPIAVQLFGSDVDKLIEAAKLIEPYADIIDYNMGCPSSKVNKQLAGATLLQEPKLVKELLTSLVKSVNKPVSLKLRAGISQKNKKLFLKIVKIAEEAGISMITLHARTLDQGYSGKADWSLIKELKENTKIPIVGNGDIKCPEDAKKMLEETGCDYIMVGRAARGNPFLFEQINDYLKTGKYTLYTSKDKFKIFKKYVKLAEKNGIGFPIIKSQSMYFTKGIERGSELRNKISKTENTTELMTLFE